MPNAAAPLLTPIGQLDRDATLIPEAPRVESPAGAATTAGPELVLPEPIVLPSPLALLAGAGGHLAFGLTAVAFSGGDGAGLPLVVFLAPIPVALFATQITLGVGHQWLGLAGRPDDLPRACARAWMNGGRLAFGLVPLLLWFATTGDPALFRALAATLGFGVGLATLFGAAGAVRDALPTRPANVGVTDLLVTSWFALTGAIGLVLVHQLG